MDRTSLRQLVLESFCQSPTPPDELLREFASSASESDRKGLFAALSIRPEVRTWQDLTFHALNVISAKGFNWLVPTYLFFALDTPLKLDGNERLFFEDLFRFLLPWETDENPESEAGQPWEFLALDHAAWIKEVMKGLSPDQKHVIAQVAKVIANQENPPGKASESLVARWNEFL